MLKVIAVVAVVIFLLAIGPFLIVWSWNVLFGSALTIPFTLETWAAVILLGAFLRANVTVKRQN